MRLAAKGAIALSSQDDTERPVHRATRRWPSSQDGAEQPRERMVARRTPSGQEGVEWAAGKMLSA